jgi:hypothetical protein
MVGLGVFIAEQSICDWFMWAISIIHMSHYLFILQPEHNELLKSWKLLRTLVCKDPTDLVV